MFFILFLKISFTSIILKAFLYLCHPHNLLYLYDAYLSYRNLQLVTYTMALKLPCLYQEYITIGIYFHLKNSCILFMAHKH